MTNLTLRELCLAVLALRAHADELTRASAEIREKANYSSADAVCKSLEEQAKEQLALASKIENMENGQ